MKEIQIKVGVIIAFKNRILLIKEWSNKKNGYFWNIIKGTYGDVLNESIKECAIRESLEEAGLVVHLKYLLPCIVLHNEKKSQIQYNFIAKKASDKIIPPSQAEQMTRNEDITEIKWFSKKEIRGLKEDDFVSEKSYMAIHDWIDKKTIPLAFLCESIK